MIVCAVLCAVSWGSGHSESSIGHGEGPWPDAPKLVASATATDGALHPWPEASPAGAPCPLVQTNDVVVGCPAKGEITGEPCGDLPDGLLREAPVTPEGPDGGQLALPGPP